MSNITQSELDRFAETLSVRYRVLDNRADGGCSFELSAGRCFFGTIELTAGADFAAAGWAIYFSEINTIKNDGSSEFNIEHINGDLHRIVPTMDFAGFIAGETKSIPFRAGGGHLSEAGIMPNYYIVTDGLAARLISSTKPIVDAETGLERLQYIDSFSDVDRQFKASSSDRTQWARPETLYELNQDLYLDTSVLDSAILPTPKRIEVSSIDARLDLGRGISLQVEGLRSAKLEAALQRLAFLGVKEVEAGVPVRVGTVAKEGAVPESYRLEIAGDHIRIIASDAAGAFYALQSLASLIQPGNAAIPLMTVIDEPRYAFRGMHLDVARNFHSKNLVLKILDQMAAYKLNKFHLHLGDDEGWRLEIPGLPELTEVGSKRCHDLTESECLLPQLGSGPYGSSEVDGFYTVADYEEILRAADARHIQVIPSFDMPGHSRAAIKSMEARYRKLMAVGDRKAAEQYLLSDSADTTVYDSVQHYNDNTINVCMDSTYTFIEKVIDETRRMHQTAGQPLTRYHIGADETAGAWRDSPVCKAFLKQNKQGVHNVSELGGYFIERVSGILQNKKIIPGGWSDGISETQKTRMPAVVQANAWGTISQQGVAVAHELANRGWQVVLSTPDVLYFDFPQAADPQERGYYWASRQTTARKVFEFMPDNLPVHAEFWSDVRGQDIEINDRLEKVGEEVLHGPLQADVRFFGMQGHLWSETIRSDSQVEYMIFPRMLALAERAWHQAEWEVPYDYQGAIYNKRSARFTDAMRLQRDREWNRIANILGQKEFKKLDMAGIDYRIPTVGACVSKGKLSANTGFPGLPIEYRAAGSDWQTYSGEVEVGVGQIEVRASSADGRRKGRALSLTPAEKQVKEK